MLGIFKFHGIIIMVWLKAIKSMFMKKELEKLRKDALIVIKKFKTLAELDAFEIEYFGRKDGKLNNILN